jgi:hypothetical protein
MQGRSKHKEIDRYYVRIYSKIQGVHMKFIPLYCNIAHELRETGMKTKCT